MRGKLLTSFMLALIILNAIAIVSAEQQLNVTDENDIFYHLNISSSNIVYYNPFAVNTTGKTYDFTQYSNDGFLQNVTFTSNGKLGNAYNFDGVSSRINIPFSQSLNLTRNFSISFWYNASTLPTQAVWISQWDGTNNTWRIFKQGAGNNIRFEVIDSGGASRTATTGTLTGSVWQHIVAVLDNQILRVYVNGVLDVSSVSFSGVITSNNKNITIGADANPTAVDYYNGTLDMFMITNKSLNATEVSQLYNLNFAKFVSRGYDLHTNINLSQYRGTINVSSTCETLNGTYLSFQAGSSNGTDYNYQSEVNFSNCNVLNYNVNGTLSNFSIKYYLNSNPSLAYSPVILEPNISIATIFNESYCTPTFQCDTFNSTCANNPPSSKTCTSASDTTSCCAMTGLASDCVASNLSLFDEIFVFDMLQFGNLIVPSYPYVDVNTSYPLYLTIPTNNQSNMNIFIHTPDGTNVTFPLNFSGGHYTTTLFFSELGDYPFKINGTNYCTTLTGSIIGTFKVRSPYYVTFKGYLNTNKTKYTNEFAYLLAEPTNGLKISPIAEQFLFPISNRLEVTPVFHAKYENGEAVLKLWETGIYKIRLVDGQTITFPYDFSPPNVTLARGFFTQAYQLETYVGSVPLSTNRTIEFVMTDADIHQYRWLFNWAFMIMLIIAFIGSIFLFFMIPQYPLISLGFGTIIIGFGIILRIAIWIWKGI